MSEGFALLPYVERFPEKVEAWRLTREAERRGELKRQPCEVCGSSVRVNAHHPDYAKPLEIMWLCTRHHIAWHRENGPGLNGGDPADLGGYGFGEVDLSGQRFGRLVILREHERRPGEERTWLCQCDCGKKCCRTGAKLRVSASLGASSMCKSCASKAREYSIQRRREGHIRRYEFTGSLYGDAWVEKIENDLRERFAEEFGPLDLPLAGSVKSAGLGSLWSVESVESDQAMTLEEIGDYFGVTRERIRQIETKAMEVLRRNARHIVTDASRTPLAVSIRARVQSWPTKKPKARCSCCGSAAHRRPTCPKLRKQEAA